MNAEPALPQEAMTVLGETVFDRWLAASAADPWQPLTEEAAKPYGFIWQSWLRFLAGHDLKWDQAQAVDVLGFINHAPQSPKQPQPSDITRRRYWRVLDRIYDFALLHTWVASNPADQLSPADRPPSEDPKGAILAPNIWRALLASLPAAEDLITTRDRAILLLLIHLALTPEEVRHLQVVDIEGLDSEAPQLRIHGERDCQPRTLPIPAPLRSALNQWLAQRQSYPAMLGQSALFCTRKAPVLSRHTLLHLVTKTIKLAAHQHGLPLPPRLGPQAIRNTVLVQWLTEGRTIEEVLSASGMKHPNALIHLSAFI